MQHVETLLQNSNIVQVVFNEKMASMKMEMFKEHFHFEICLYIH